MQGNRGYKKIYILAQSRCVAIKQVLVSGIRPRIGVLPERGVAVKRRIVSAPRRGSSSFSLCLPPASGERADVAAPAGDPEWVRRAEVCAAVRAHVPPVCSDIEH